MGAVSNSRQIELIAMGDDREPYFEGVEKLLEVWFVDLPLSNADLRLIPRAKLEGLLKVARCEIISYMKNDQVDAYILSESSMFVSKRRFILKTCGTTTPLLCLTMLLDLAEEYAGFVEVEDLFYSRKNFKRPELQITPHQHFDQEVELLDSLFPDGMAYCLGAVNRDCWFLYTLNSLPASHLSSGVPLANPYNADQTLEMLMTDLDPEIMAIFTKEECLNATEATRKSGIDQIIPNMVIDDFLFEPCGYSMNGVTKNGCYMTVHITPESDFSYVSFETNYPCRSYYELIANILKTFSPGKFTVTIFSNQDWNITCCTTGNNQLVLCDSSGQIHLITRGWQIYKSFVSYELTVEMAYQAENASILITIGQDEPGVNPLIKVWDTSRSGVPYCSRITRAIPGYRPVYASSLAVHENLHLMAVGFIDGSIVLYRGDVQRERGTKQKILRDSAASSTTITGLAFKSTSIGHLLYVATEDNVLFYNVTHKDKEQKSHLDNVGCKKKCSVLAENLQDCHYMVGRNDAVYCYTADGRGSCYAVDGEKNILEWYRNYLVIVASSNSGTATVRNGQNDQLITVLDIHNKFIVFSAPFTTPIRAVLTVWGGLYLLDVQNTVYQLEEKDLQAKLQLLFRKNLYDVAIRIARSHQYDSDGMMEIFRQYGDHLCDKSDYSGAVEQYAKTIGKLEASYVIRKFLDGQHIESLLKYLQRLHEKRYATEDHTELLLNCMRKLEGSTNRMDFDADCTSLKTILKQDANYNVEIAIKFLRQYSPTDALQLAKAHRKHEWYMRLQIDDHQNYKAAVEYLIVCLNEEDFDADCYIKLYGKRLMENAPLETTKLLKRLCANDGCIDPEDYIHLFGKKSSNLVDFISYLIEQKCRLSTSVYNTLIQHYIHLWKESTSVAESTNLSAFLVDLLRNQNERYDANQALIVSHWYGFTDGILYFYEQQKQYVEIVRYHLDRNNTQAALAACRRFDQQCPKVWVQALWLCLQTTPAETVGFLLHEILDVIARDRLMSPQLVIDAICSPKRTKLHQQQSSISLGTIRTFVLNHVLRMRQETAEIVDVTERYRRDIDTIRAQLDQLKTGSFVIQRARCAACHHSLELPTVHFFCEHSYHQYCFQSFSDDEKGECPACQPTNQSLLELLKARQPTDELQRNFHEQLLETNSSLDSDGFSVVAKYLGCSMFNKYSVVIGEPDFNGETTTTTAESKDIIVKTSKSESRSLNPFLDDDDYDDANNPFVDSNSSPEKDGNEMNPFLHDL